MLIGHSDGGQTALEFGLRYPGRAAGLVLSGTMSEPTADYLAGIRRWGFTGPGDVDIDRIIADFGDDLEPMRAAHGRAADDAGWLEYLQQISTPWHTVPSYTADQLGGVTDPTLVITGHRDELADLDQARRLFDGIPGSQLDVVPGAGHDGADEPIFWQLVRRFVDSSAERSGGSDPARSGVSAGSPCREFTGFGDLAGDVGQLDIEVLTGRA